MTNRERYGYNLITVVDDSSDKSIIKHFVITKHSKNILIHEQVAKPSCEIQCIEEWLRSKYREEKPDIKDYIVNKHCSSKPNWSSLCYITREYKCDNRRHINIKVEQENYLKELDYILFNYWSRTKPKFDVIHISHRNSLYEYETTKVFDIYTYKTI